MKRVSMPKTTALRGCLFFAFVIQVIGVAFTTSATGSVRQAAQSHGWKLEGTTAQGKSYELIAVENGRPVYYITYNADAANLTGASILHNPPYSLDGNDLTVGIWDAGWVLDTHQEFDSRVTIKDANSVFDNHATHVAGTIGASGINPDANGMAPAVNIDSYDWTLDTSEMAVRAAAGPGGTGKIYLSNHSYGTIAGWEFGSFNVILGDFNSDDRVNFADWAIFAYAWLSTPSSPNWNSVCDIAPWPDGNGEVNNLDLKLFAENWLKVNVEAPYWFGVWGELEDRNLGRYGSNTVVWDELCHSAPYYLPFKAAGNDRDNDVPLNGTDFWYLDPNDPNNPADANDPNNGRWVKTTYDSNDPNTPYGDGWDNGGYDTIPTIGTAKNIMTVGAVDDIGDMTVFSGWGPTDDGRIKPDIVANGFELYSPVAVNDVNYATYSGTSRASASAAGSAALLVQYYNRLFPNKALRASTLKGLIIHTATDKGNLGPDYRYGWGLMDVNSAADYIKKDYEDPSGQRIIEGVLTAGQTKPYTFTFDGSSPFIRATLCWIDPPGSAVDELDSNSPRLINDLDLRILDNSDPNISYHAYILDPNSPAADANTGDNVLDNVEQVYIDSPPVGTYTVEIGHKGTLTNGLQNYSLILNKPKPVRNIFVDDNAPNDLGPGDPDISDPAEDGTSEHPFDSIQEAIDDADDGDSVFIRDGTYTGTGNYDIDTGGKAITVKSEGGSQNCIVDCESQGRAFIFQNGEGATTVLDGLTTVNGYAEDPDWPQEPNDIDNPDGYGGAIYCTNASSPVISNCIMMDNLADYGGGAVFCNKNSSPFISSCDISYNDCGSGIYYIFDPLYYDVNQLGGGIYCTNASPTIYNCTISHNWADGSGGGIACVNSNAVIADCNVTHNECWADNDYTYQHGGGIYCNRSTIEIRNCTVEWNSAAWCGGGIDVLESNSRIELCKITNNSCWASGGGICSDGGFDVNDPNILSMPNCYLINCLVTNNWGYWSGGIGSLYGSLMDIDNCTIANNTASWKDDPYPHLVGGLECYYGGANVKNSIFWGNSGSQIEGIRDVNDANNVDNLVVTYSDIQMIDSNGLPDPGSIWLGVGNINAEPLFAGPKRSDYHLQTEWPNGRWNPQTGMFDLTDPNTSPCINAGDPSSDYSLEPAPNGERVNMGTYGNTNQASKLP